MLDVIDDSSPECLACIVDSPRAGQRVRIISGRQPSVCWGSPALERGGHLAIVPEMQHTSGSLAARLQKLTMHTTDGRLAFRQTVGMMFSGAAAIARCDRGYF
jgi:hypothetical protein